MAGVGHDCSLCCFLCGVWTGCRELAARHPRRICVDHPELRTSRGWTIPTSFLLGGAFWLRWSWFLFHGLGVFVGMPSLGVLSGNDSLVAVLVSRNVSGWRNPPSTFRLPTSDRHVIRADRFPCERFESFTPTFRAAVVEFEYPIWIGFNFFWGWQCVFHIFSVLDRFGKIQLTEPSGEWNDFAKAHQSTSFSFSK